ncbi:MAG TPA: ribose-phosphate pyrophosphokinase [Ignavibacteria bacterium]|nr:ribose-phosphate pyrophosphokinase [Ignavibacteria bacterium]HMR40521.1 ribose-phosphate pyrophosphokinase [Ignavibacteria bacterium]
MSDLKIFAGRYSEYLGKKIAHDLKSNLGKCSIETFSDGEIWVKYNENVRGSDVFIIQSTIPPADNLMELLIMIDAAKRASARRVTAVIPYFGYARQDRKDQPRVAITAKLVANLITKAGADRVITMDLHASQLQGFFDIPVDHLYGSAVFMKKFRKMKIPNLGVASPDVGGIKMARAYAKRLHCDLILIDKRRPKPNVAEIMNIIGEVRGKNILILDDLIDTGGTFVNAVNALNKNGAGDIYGACTHAVFSGESLKRINSSPLKKLFVADTLPLTHTSKKIEVVSVSGIFAESIWRTNKNKSISSLFDVDKGD